MYANDSMNINSTSPSSSLTTDESVNSEVNSTTDTMTTTALANSSSSKAYMNKKLTAMEVFLNSVGDHIVPNITLTSRATIIEELRSYRSLVNKYNSKNPPDTSSFLTFF